MDQNILNKLIHEITRSKGESFTLTQLDKMVLHALGDSILSMILDDTVTEIYVNPDYYIRKATNTGRVKTEILLSSAEVRSICSAISGYNGQVISEDAPQLGVELSNLMLRAQICYPPVTKKPIFFLRKKARQIFTLKDYVQTNALTEQQYTLIQDLIKAKKNIIVVGGTGSGKTTFLNALLHELETINSKLHIHERLLLLEDLPELQSSSDDVLCMNTSGNKKTNIDMRSLVHSSLRLSPDRIIIGEVRDSSAYDMLKAWNTGHEGGFCTTHANSPEDGLDRLEVLSMESSDNINPSMIKHAIGRTVDAIISIQKIVTPDGTHRKVDRILLVDSYDSKSQSYVFKS